MRERVRQCRQTQGPGRRPLVQAKCESQIWVDAKSTGVAIRRHAGRLAHPRRCPATCRCCSSRSRSSPARGPPWRRCCCTPCSHRRGVPWAGRPTAPPSIFPAARKQQQQQSGEAGREEGRELAAAYTREEPGAQRLAQNGLTPKPTPEPAYQEDEQNNSLWTEHMAHLRLVHAFSLYSYLWDFL